MPRLSLIVLALFAGCASADTPKSGEGSKPIELRGSVSEAGLSLAEAEKPVVNVFFNGSIDVLGAGKGVLTLDPTPLVADEVGNISRGPAVPAVKLDCSLKFAKKVQYKVTYRRLGAPPIEAETVVVEWRIYEVSGPKIVSRLTLATEANADWKSARLIVHDKDGKPSRAVSLTKPEPELFPPCHPGCFPAGTPVRTPDGTTPIETIKVGDVVTTIGPDGKAAKNKVDAVFVTRNTLVELTTDRGVLLTTDIQPLALADGGSREAGQLKKGDKVWTFDGKARTAAVVASVKPTGREAKVFNLVVSDRLHFVAGGFVARSKPPAAKE